MRRTARVRGGPDDRDPAGAPEDARDPGVVQDGNAEAARLEVEMVRGELEVLPS